MGVFLTGDVYLIELNTPVGVFVLIYSLAIALLSLGFIVWFIHWSPFAKHHIIQNLMIVVAVLSFMDISLLLCGYELTKSSLAAGSAFIVAGLLASVAFSAQLEILMLFRPLSDLITRERLNLLQANNASAHFISCGLSMILVEVLQLFYLPTPIVYYIVFAIALDQTIPDWILNWYYIIYSLGFLLFVTMDIMQNIFLCIILYNYTERRKGADLTEDEIEKRDFSQQKVFQYLRYLFIISIIDLVAVGVFYFAEAPVAKFFASTIAIIRIFVFFVGFRYLLDIPFGPRPSKTSKEQQNRKPLSASPSKNVENRPSETFLLDTLVISNTASNGTG